ncbi:hypothetical protein FN846DRAFT_910036 [Sphaerosporella brunnea]|uniref:Uncharacterized protein n=1 Tax=Sphaerosporella brunnea TaxID=1250544 RepID=A0A5J5END1_9PEZI|nr:hypothetical protein FN846DRAFT_910036 [Sphaerosporella brunnea]
MSSATLPSLEEVLHYSRSELLEFLRSNLPEETFDEEDLEIFRKAKISSDQFLKSDIEWFLRVFALGPAQTLVDLSQRIKEDRKHATTAKKRNASEVCPELDAPARKRLTLDQPEDTPLIKHCRQLWEHIEKVPDDYEDYSDPSKVLRLPFPSAYSRKPTDRFKLDDTGEFDYMGRIKFREVYEAVSKLKIGISHQSYSLQGSLGYGKSHILAALACLLLRQGKLVVYLPDCRTMAQDYVKYLKTALMFTFALHPNVLPLIREVHTKEELVHLFAWLEDQGHSLWFIVDQMEALEEDTQGGTLRPAQKEAALSGINELVAFHYTIWGSTGNNADARADSARQIHQGRTLCVDGFTNCEMEQWWQNFSKSFPVSLAPGDRKLIEDITGCSPILLRVFLTTQDILVDNDTAMTDQNSPAKIYSRSLSRMFEYFWASAEVQNLIGNVLNFAAKTKEQCLGKSPEFFECYLDTSEACLTQGIIDRTAEKWIDWRYFYASKRRGYCTSGLARKTLATFLRKESANSTQRFLSSHWYESLKLASNNPSVLGFLIEEIILSSIAEFGCQEAGEYFDQKRIPVTTFLTDQVQLVEDQLQLYIPRAWKYPGIVGVLIHRDNSSKKAFIVPIQVTVNQNYLELADEFFTRRMAMDWASPLDGYETMVRILWIKEDIGTDPKKYYQSALKILKSYSNIGKRFTEVRTLQANQPIEGRHQRVP